MKELLIFSFFLTAPATGLANDEGEAYRNIALASYKQSGLESMVDKYVEQELKQVPQGLKTVVSNTYLIGKTIQERKVNYSWTF